MAKNIKMEPGYRFSFACSSPASPVSGDPVRIGNMTGVALEDMVAATGLCTVHVGSFVASLSVKAVDGVGNSAVEIGDALYYVDADTPKLSKKSSGYFFGYANGTVSAGATATIDVIHPACAGKIA
jgi:predicted RecA/RadA family phage recombinase